MTNPTTPDTTPSPTNTTTATIFTTTTAVAHQDRRRSNTPDSGLAAPSRTFSEEQDEFKSLSSLKAGNVGGQSPANTAGCQPAERSPASSGSHDFNALTTAEPLQVRTVDRLRVDDSRVGSTESLQLSNTDPLQVSEGNSAALQTSANASASVPQRKVPPLPEFPWMKTAQELPKRTVGPNHTDMAPPVYDRSIEPRAVPSGSVSLPPPYQRERPKRLQPLIPRTTLPVPPLPEPDIGVDWRSLHKQYLAERPAPRSSRNRSSSTSHGRRRWNLPCLDASPAYSPTASSDPEDSPYDRVEHGNSARQPAGFFDWICYAVAYVASRVYCPETLLCL